MILTERHLERNQAQGGLIIPTLEMNLKKYSLLSLSSSFNAMSSEHHKWVTISHKHQVLSHQQRSCLHVGYYQQYTAYLFVIFLIFIWGQ